MKIKRGETAEETVNRWAYDLLKISSGDKSAFECSEGDYDRALEMVEWLRRRLEVLKVQNT